MSDRPEPASDSSICRRPDNDECGAHLARQQDSEVPESGPMKREVARGLFWILLEVGSGQGINFLAFILLSRLLGPEDYGVASLAGVVSAFFQLALTRGLADAVVAHPELDEEALSTAFWGNLLVAVALFVLVQVAAGGFAWCFGQPLVAPMLRWFSLCFFTTALTFIPLATLRRRLRFGTYAVRAAIGAASGGLVGIAMALTGFGIWSLVGAQIGQGVAAVAAVWFMAGWRPRLCFSTAALRTLAPFSAHNVSGAVLDFLANRIDILAVGLFLDATSLGYYYLLKRVLQAAVGATIYPPWSIMMPALRRLLGDWGRFNRAYTSLVAVAHACWVLLIAALCSSAPNLLPTVFGPRWVGATPLFEAASLLGVSFAITMCTSQALGAIGRSNAYLPLGILQVTLTAALVGPAACLGVVATGPALAFSSILMLPFHIRTLRRFTGLHPWQLLRPCLGITAAGVLAAGLVVILRMAALQALPVVSVPVLATMDVVLCVLLYLAGLSLLARGTLVELVALARSMLPRRLQAASAARLVPEPELQERAAEP